MVIRSFIVVACLLVASAANAESVGACTWSKVSQPARQAVLDAYKTGMQNGMAELASLDKELRPLVSVCAGRDDIPLHWAQALLASEAIQAGAAAELSSTKGISRDTLDEVWRNASDPTRQCVRANAAKVFGITNEVCTDARGPLPLLSQLKLSPQTDRSSAEQALYYFNAKAQTDWAEALIAKFQSEVPKKS